MAELTPMAEFTTRLLLSELELKGLSPWSSGHPGPHWASVPSSPLTGPSFRPSWPGFKRWNHTVEDPGDAPTQEANAFAHLLLVGAGTVAKEDRGQAVATEVAYTDMEVTRWGHSHPTHQEAPEGARGAGGTSQQVPQRHDGRSRCWRNWWKTPKGAGSLARRTLANTEKAPGWGPEVPAGKWLHGATARTSILFPAAALGEVLGPEGPFPVTGWGAHAMDTPWTHHAHDTCTWAHAVDTQGPHHGHVRHSPRTCHAHGIHGPWTLHGNTMDMPWTHYGHTRAT